MNSVNLQNLIKPGKLMVFSGTYCPFCDMTKNTLNKYKIPYEVKELDLEPIDTQTRKKLDVLSGISTIPKVFVGLQCVGGNSEMQALIKSGEFKEMLQEEKINTGSL